MFSISNSDSEDDIFKIEPECDKDYIALKESDCDNVNDLVNHNSDNNCDNIVSERKSKRKKSPFSR